MPAHGSAVFVKRPRRIEDIAGPHPLEMRQEYEVVKTIRLAKTDYDNLITDLAADRQFLEDNAELCSKCGNIIRCLRVIGRGHRDGILIVPDAAWVDIAALEPETPTDE